MGGGDVKKKDTEDFKGVIAHYFERSVREMEINKAKRQSNPSPGSHLTFHCKEQR
jgi:hypothetical protein